MNWRSYAASWKEFDLYYDRFKPGRPHNITPLSAVVGRHGEVT